jgi:hypothetical protein
VHASVLAGIIDGQFPFKPPWADGVDIVLTFGLGRNSRSSRRGPTASTSC